MCPCSDLSLCSDPDVCGGDVCIVEFKERFPARGSLTRGSSAGGSSAGRSVAGGPILSGSVLSWSLVFDGQYFLDFGKGLTSDFLFYFSFPQ